MKKKRNNEEEQVKERMMREFMIFSHKDHRGKLMIENEREIKGKKEIKDKHEKIRETMKKNYSMIL